MRCSPWRGRRRSVLAWVGSTAYWQQQWAEAVLRYPDGAFESRFPLHVDECGQVGDPQRISCLLQLRQHMLEDTDCNRVICDQSETSTPIQAYAELHEWLPYKFLCGTMQELFLDLFDLALSQQEQLSGRNDSDARANAGAAGAAAVGGSTAKQLVTAFRESAGFWIESIQADESDPSYANTTLSVLRWHYDKALEVANEIMLATSADTEELLQASVQMARRLQLLIENMSLTLLVNVQVGRVKDEGETLGRELLHELYGDPRLIKTKFHEIPGKRWDALGFLLDQLGVSERPVFMAEVGVEAANTSHRLLERNPNLSYLGVDPYEDNDGLYQEVVQKLSSFGAAGRLILDRRTSSEAAESVPEGYFDLVFLDARHDFDAVWDDVTAWHRKVRPGGILSGHDFSWIYPTVVMAIYKAAFSTPERVIHLTPDGVWYFQL